MGKGTLMKPLSFVLGAMLCIAPFVANARAENRSWIKVASNNNLQSISMVNSTDGWAVGGDGTIIHWDGTKWDNVPSPTKYPLLSVDMVSSDEGYAIAFGQVTPINQSVIRWDGTSWKNMTTPLGYLRSVHVLSSTDGWAVGYAGRIMRFDGTNWTYAETPTNTPLESLDAIDAADAWAVGDNRYHSGIFHWNGTTWNVAKSPDSLGTRTLWSVDMISSTNGWAVGDGIILQWNGTNWYNVSNPVPRKSLFSVNVINSTDGWAVGTDGCIIHWNGASWSNVTSPTCAWLSCVDMVSSTDGWISGADGIYRWQPAGFPAIYVAAAIAVIAVTFTIVLVSLKKFKSRNLTVGQDSLTNS